MRPGSVLLWLVRRPAIIAVPVLLALFFAGHRAVVTVRARMAARAIDRAPFQPLPCDYVPDEVLVHPRASDAASISAVVAQAGAASAVPVQNTGLVRLKLGAGRSVTDALAALAGSSAVEWAEPNFRVHTCRTPDGPRFAELWGMRNIGRAFESRACGKIQGKAGADIGAERAWDVSCGGEVIVGVIDTGIDYTHPSLAPNMWRNPGEIPDNGIDDDRNGYVDDVYGYDFVNRKGDPKDDHGHGTHCAGTIGASNKDGTGVVGVNWQVKLMALKFLDKYGSGTIADAAEAIAYARSFGVPVTNNSWGGGGMNKALLEAIRGYKGLFIAAAGNARSDCDTIPFYPGAYDLPNVLCVAASDPGDGLGCFSNWGQTEVDVAAPGVAILSTLPTYPCTLTEHGFQQGYDYLDGTSMATPHATGAAALLRACQGAENEAQRRHRLIATSRVCDALRGTCVGNGCIDLNTAATARPVPPIAEAGCDTAAPPSYAVALDASASKPYPGRSIAQFIWSEGGKELRRSRAPAFTYKSNDQGIHRVELQAVDDQGAVGRDSVAIQIAERVMTGASLNVERQDRSTLWVTLTVLDVATKKPVPDAEAALLLQAPGPWLFKAGGRTNRYGQFHSEWKMPGRLVPGRYEAKLLSLTHMEHAWDRKRTVGIFDL